MDPQLGKGLKAGYTFSLVLGNLRPFYTGFKNVADKNACYGVGHTTWVNGKCWHAWAWSSAAWPISYKETGIRSFYIDELGLVRGSDTGGGIGTIRMPGCD